jgi:hypothetical protein
LDIPSSVTTIGDYSFCGCSGLTELEISSSVTTIGGSAFWGCSGLTQLEIPSSFSMLGGYAFNGVDQLERLTLLDSQLVPAVVEILVDSLTPTAKVIGRDLVGRKFDRFTIAAA